MIQIKIKSDLRKLEKKFKGIIESAFSKDRMDVYAMFLANLIKKRTRLGYGVKGDGADKTLLKPLNSQYILFRKMLKSFQSRKAKAKKPEKTQFKLTKKQMEQASVSDLRGVLFFQKHNKVEDLKLSQDTTPSKSNLTLSGQLLDQITGRGVGIGKAEVLIEEKRNDGKKNSDIVEWQENQKRMFFRISKLEKQQLINTAKKDLSDYIKKQFK